MTAVEGRSRLAASALARWRASLDFHQPDLVLEAIGQDRVAVRGYIHVAHDVTAARDDPALKFFALRIEANDRVRLGCRFAVPNRSLREHDTVRFGLGSAGRAPFLDVATHRVQSAKKSAREICVPDHVVGPDGDAARTGSRIG